METFDSPFEPGTAAERRRERMQEARRRVEVGETTPGPPPTARARTSPRKTASSPVRVVPEETSGGRFAMWRSAQHFCSADSIPDAESADLAKLVRWSDSIMEFRLRQRLVARHGDDGIWQPVCFVKDANQEKITEKQAQKFRDIRLGKVQAPKEKFRELQTGDHPSQTETV